MNANATTDVDLLDLQLTFERLKIVERQNPLSNSARRENTAEHSWSVALAVIIFHGLATVPVDLGHALALAVAHDLPEAFVGDTFVYGHEADSRSTRERLAMDSFLAEAGPGSVKSELVDLWQEYESAATPEARYVLALDVLLPVFFNSRNLDHSSWKRHGVQAADVRARVRMVEDVMPRLAQEAYQAIDHGVRHGALKGP
ncbi:HD domain-containing protein [Micromonospora sp. CA-244673]|uniref:HD domain-containing protein n=1 Tax=Micromonospora sp. CA-244673 TaxID=3239958 RepID=UPI003D8B269F